ncbi:HET domain-containing protein [Fusarium sp. LHS14.1]|nr:HET domain-containing protein [Fusarium sp. LHS14.1]
MVIDLEHKAATQTEKAPGTIVLFKPKLDALLSAQSNCQFSQWLVKGLSTKCLNWPGLEQRAGDISLCIDYLTYTFDPLPLVEVTWFGLWDPREDFDEERGRCQVRYHSFLDVIACPDNPASEFVSTRPINPSIGSQKNLVLSRRWIQECMENHVDCPALAGKFMPKYVLKLSQNADQYHVSIYQPFSPEPYTALSYCWGGDQPHKTTRAKINSGNLELDYHILPASIQDAIKVTVGLGYQYLWVDSLCIVQDEGQEKAEQIALMPNIYTSAIVTIVASRANRAIDGFLHEIDVKAVTNLCFKLPFKCPGSSTVGTVFLSKINNVDDPEPIDFRGWTFQERFLSPRVLDFATKQLSWTCSSSSVDEGFRDGWKLRSLKQDRLFLENNFFTKQMGSAVPAVNGSHIDIQNWRLMVAYYTRRRLTFPKDRILAISGVAGMFATVLKDQYAAGHWKQSLPFDLLWSKSPESTPERRPSEYLAPSWSWAAVTGEVWFWYAHKVSPSDMPPVTPDVHLTDVLTELEEQTAVFGAVTSGCIKGSGSIRKLVWFGNQETPDHFHALHDYTLEGDVRPVPLMRMIPDAIEDEFAKDPSRKDISIPVHLLHVGTCTNWGIRGLFGLVLREMASASQRRRFTRLGIFHNCPPRGRKRRALGVARPWDSLAEGDNLAFFADCVKEEFEII